MFLSICISYFCWWLTQEILNGFEQHVLATFILFNKIWEKSNSDWKFPLMINNCCMVLRASLISSECHINILIWKRPPPLNILYSYSKSSIIQTVHGEFGLPLLNGIVLVHLCSCQCCGKFRTPNFKAFTWKNYLDLTIVRFIITDNSMLIQMIVRYGLYDKSLFKSSKKQPTVACANCIMHYQI